jgi:hypothetical protein
MPISKTPSFVVNTIVTQEVNEQVRSSTTALNDGRFLISWTADTGPTNLKDIKARIYNADGTAVSDPFTVNSTLRFDQNFSHAVEMTDGRIFVVYESSDGGVSGKEIRARIFTSNGTPTGPDVVINSTTSNDQSIPDVEVLSDGRLLVAWRSDEGAATGIDIRARLFNSNGTALGPDFIMNSDAAGDQGQATSAALADGRFVVTWLSGKLIKGQVFASDGSRAGSEFLANTTSPFSIAIPRVAKLDDGGFAVAWYSLESVSEPSGIRLRLFNVDGTARGPDVAVPSGFNGQKFYPGVTSLEDGRFLLTWVATSTAREIRGLFYGPDGAPLGSDFLIAVSDLFTQGNPSVSSLADGRIVVSWDGLDSSLGYVVKSTILDPNSFTGTDGVDVWIGGNSVDRMFGYDGDDTFSGRAGEDFLNGGGGSDTLQGDAGNDRLEGGLSNDLLFGNLDNDTLWGGQGVDTLNGGRGSDKFLYMNRNEGGDSIVKFQSGDKIVFEGQAFKLGNQTGKLKAANFKSGTTNKAGDANDYFIYRTGDDTLWFDADGKGGAGPIKIADLTNNYNLSVGDILII